MLLINYNYPFVMKVSLILTYFNPPKPLYDKHAFKIKMLLTKQLYTDNNQAYRLNLNNKI